MITQAYLPVGTALKSERLLIKKGDIVKLCTGETVTFTEMKRVKFIGLMNGKGIQVPVYRNKTNDLPYIESVTGKVDKSVFENRMKSTSLKYGNLFALEGHKETFMYIGAEVKRGKDKLMGVDLATGIMFTIGSEMNIVKVNIPALKKKFVSI